MNHFKEPISKAIDAMALSQTRGLLINNTVKKTMKTVNHKTLGLIFWEMQITRRDDSTLWKMFSTEI